MPEAGDQQGQKPHRPGSLIRGAGVVFLLLVAGTAPAYANAGTPLMWATFFHLFIGNALIGTVEGLLVAWFFKAPPVRSILLLVAANYLSMFTGLIVLAFLADGSNQWLLGSTPLYNAPRVLILLGLASYAYTVLVEWAFCTLALWGDAERRWKRGLRASLAVNSISYAVLVAFYLCYSGISLYTNASTDRNLVASTPNDAVIFYLSPDRQEVWSVNVNGTDNRQVKQAVLQERCHSLALTGSEGADYLDLSAATWRSGRQEDAVLISRIAAWQDHELSPIGDKPDLRPRDRRQWQVHTNTWAWWGLQAANKSSGQSFSLAFETPFGAWQSRSATALPGDRVVYELGHLIVLLDIERRKIGLICLGKSPVVVPRAWLEAALPASPEPKP